MEADGKKATANDAPGHGDPETAPVPTVPAPGIETDGTAATDGRDGAEGATRAARGGKKATQAVPVGNPARCKSPSR